MADAVLQALAGGVRVYDLGREMFAGMPQSPNHPRYRMALERRHGDVVRPDGGSAANEIIVTGGHVGTHVDALAHVSQAGRLHGDVDAVAAQSGGRFAALGIETVEPFVTRGVLLDVAAVRGELDGGYEITSEDLEDARAGLDIGAGDVALVRTGWGSRWDDPEAFGGRASGVPGIGEAGARWIAALGVRAAGGDTIAFERIAPGTGHAVLPVHRVLLVEHGIHIFETLDLDGLASDGVREFLFVASPLKLVGATGSPVRPLAVVGTR